MKTLEYPLLRDLLNYIRKKYGSENYYFQTFYECFKVYFDKNKNIENEIITPDILATIKQNKFDYLINSDIFKDEYLEIPKLIKWYNYNDPNFSYVKIYEDDYLEEEEIIKKRYRKEGFRYIIEKLLFSGLIIFYTENLEKIFNEIFFEFYTKK